MLDQLWTQKQLELT